jgi:hypothetical protein
MLLINKKGMEAGFLVALIITIVGGLLVGGVVMRFMSNTTDKEAENLCHDSIALRAKTAITHEGTFDREVIKSVPVLCKTIDKKITGDREEIKEQFAYKIARCWWMFGEGRYEELLHSSKVQFLPSLFGFDNTENKCFVCYNLMIDEKDVIIPVWEMQEYMDNHNYPGSNITYMQYIQTYGGPGKIVFGTPLIHSQTGYGISMMPKLEAGSSFWGSAGKVLAGAVIVAGVVCAVAAPCAAAVMSAVGLGGAATGTTSVAAGGTAAAAGSTAVIAGTTTTVAGTTAALSTGGIFIPLSAATEVVAAGTAVGTTAAAAGGVAAGTAAAGTAAAGTATTGLISVKTAVLAGSAGMGVSTVGVNNIIALLSERDFSIVSVLPSRLAQEQCGSGDLAGE